MAEKSIGLESSLFDGEGGATVINQKYFMLTEKSKPDFGFLPFRPRSLISLWDMIRVFAIEATNSIAWLSNWHMEIQKQIQNGGLTGKLSADDTLEFIKALDYIKGFCKTFELENSMARVGQFMFELGNGDLVLNVIEAEIKALEIAIPEELNNRHCAFIPCESVEYFEQNRLFGDDVWSAFPEARDEIKDAGNCLAADLNTAAVFHLMRVMELGLRQLAVQLKVKNLNKKSLKIKIPIELGTWDEILNTLQSKLDTLRGSTRSPKREEKIEICNELLKELRSVKDLWRNKVMHTRATYDAKQAQSAFNHVRAFMQKLAAKS